MYVEEIQYKVVQYKIKKSIHCDGDEKEGNF
jgi:hypothetical protein